MLIWNILIGTALVIILACLFFLTTRFHRFACIDRLSGTRRSAGWMLAALPSLLLLGLLRFNAVNTAVVIVHLTVFWIISDLLGLLAGRLLRTGEDTRRHPEGNAAGQTGQSHPRFYWQGLFAIAATVIYLGIGLYLDFHVWETDYRIETAKDLGRERLRVVQISDSHIGTTFDGTGFARHLRRIADVRPDVLVITGDFVDDSTRLEDMLEACEALEQMECPLGIYFVFGNHDEGYFRYREFSGEQLTDALEENGVTVLEDETVMLTDRISLTGRKDRSDPARRSAGELAEELDDSCYQILLDHQPHDFDNEAAAGFDLVLCGHTHGGQMFPIGITGELSGANDKTYGLEIRDRTAFIVNSGISDWAFWFKTAARSEFGVIDISGA